MNIIEKYLPEKCYSKNNLDSLDGCVIHYVSAKNITPEDPFNIDTILDIFSEYKVSAHYLIDRDGTVYNLVPLRRKAYHAGKSIMNGRPRVNNFSLGVELVGGLDWEFTNEQYDALAEMIKAYRFDKDWVKGHEEVRKAWNIVHPNNQGSRKYDPGPNFDWDLLWGKVG